MEEEERPNLTSGDPYKLKIFGHHRRRDRHFHDFSLRNVVIEEMEESDGVSSTQTVAGSDTVKGTQNTTVLVQMEEEERVIRAMPFVMTSSFVCAFKGKTEGCRVTLT